MPLLLAVLLATTPADLGRLPPAPVRTYTVAWTRPLVPGDLLDWQTEEPGGPAVDPGSGIVVVGLRNGDLVALQPGGEELWHFRAAGGFAAPPLIREGVVYAGSEDGKLYARELSSGRERWTYDAGEEIGSTPVAAGKLLIFNTLQDSTVAVERETGAWKWHHRRDQREGFSVRGCAPPVLLGGLVYTAYSDGWVSGLEPATGAARWERRVAPAGDFIDVDGLGSDGKVLYAAAFSGLVAAIDPATGAALWEKKVPGASRLLAADGQVYVVGSEAVVAMSARDGAPRWTQRLEGVPVATPVRAGPRLLVANGKLLLLLDPGSGMRVKVFSPGTGVSSPPAVNGRRVYALSNGSVLVALDLD